MTFILGISAYYHDSACALIRDGEIVAAAQEERFTRKKHDASFPSKALLYCLSEAQVSLKEVEYVAFYDKPFLKFERLLETYMYTAPRGFKTFSMAMPIWLREKLFLKKLLVTELQKINPHFLPKKLLFSEHHISHAASAFYPSPFEESVVLTLDGVGEWATTTVAIASGNSLDIKKELHFPNSLGLLYSAFTYYLGFKVNSGEYKVMGLAPYGEPKFVNLILETLINVKEDGSFQLNQKYFDYLSGLTMVSDEFIKLFGAPIRKPEIEPLTQFHMDVAASVQAVTEKVVLNLGRALAQEYGISNLCLAGGVALNCVSNGKLLRDGSFENIWIQPAAGDAGGALGAALGAWHRELNMPRQKIGLDRMKGSYLGPSYNTSDISQELELAGAVFHQLDEDELIERAAQSLADGDGVGWFQGRMEFGPRALGGRSILADPRSADMQETLNHKVKFRESFRPFAPSVLYDDVEDWFDLDQSSPYMLLVAEVKDKRRTAVRDEDLALLGVDKLKINRSQIPAVTHVDYSARVQTVHRETNERYYDLIAKFKMLTGCPVLVNTSFNVRGEPVVNTPTDAFKCFMGTKLDKLFIGNFMLVKEEQSASLLEDYKDMYELD